MISIGIDPGRIYGIAIYDSEIGFTYKKKENFLTLKTMMRDVKDLIEMWKPDVIVLAEARGCNRNVIKFQAAQAGVIELLCEIKKVDYIARPDNTIRKFIMNNGKASKKEVQDYVACDNEHKADAMLAALFGNKCLLA